MNTLPAPILDLASRLALEVRQGRPGALEALYREVETLLEHALLRYRRAQRLPLALEPQDLAQQTWLILAELARRWRPEGGSFAAYVNASAGWSLERYVRHQSHARRSGVVQVLSISHDAATEQAERLAGPDGRAWVDHLAYRELLAALSATQRTLLQLRLIEGYPLTEAARRMGITRDVARRLLRQVLAEAERWSSEEAPARKAPEPLERLIWTLHDGATAAGRLPGRRRACRQAGISQLCYSRLMQRLEVAGCLCARAARIPGTLTDPTPAATLRRLRTAENLSA